MTEIMLVRRGVALAAAALATSALALTASCRCETGNSSDSGFDGGPRCGNGSVELDEECDDALLCELALGGVTDGCDTMCRLETVAGVGVNNPTGGSQVFPVVAAMPNGYAVAYMDSNEDEGYNSEVRARLFDADGGPWAAGGMFAPGNDFRVTTSPSSWPQSQPALSACDDGSFAIAWADQRPPAGEDGEVRARFFTPDGSAGASDVVLNDPLPDGHSIGSGLAGACLAGTHVFVWAENVLPSPPVPAGSLLRGRVLDTSGTPVPADAAGGMPIAFDVEPNLTAGPAQPSIAVDPITNIVWVAYFSLPPTMIAGGDIFLRRLSGSFGALGTVMQVDGPEDVTVEGPQIAVLRDGGGALIVWAERGTGGTNNTVRARLFDAAGNPRPPFGSADDGYFVLDTAFSSEEPLPAPHVTALSDDTFLASWVTYSDGVLGVNLDADAAGAGAETVRVLTDLSPACVRVRNPVAAGRMDGGFVAAWETIDPSTDDVGCGLVGCGVRSRVFP